MGAGGGDNRGMITDINVTPLVDVMLVLLIIFMVTATYIARSAIDVNLPEAATGQEADQTALSIVVAPSGQILLNGEAVTVEALKARVPSIVEANPGVQAVVDGDRTVEYGRIMEIIDTLRQVGVKNFAASVEHKVE